MGNVSGVLFGNEYSLYFFYGLAFLITGAMLLMKSHTRFEFGKRVWLLAGFTLVHGIAELLHSWIYLQKNYIFAYDVSMAFMIERILIATSYMMLFFFGIELMLIVKPRMRPLRVIPALLWLGWLGYFIGWKLYTNEAVSQDSIYLSIVTSRYLIGFPASITTAAGLYILSKNNRYSETPRLNSYIKSCSITFAIYGILSGLIVWPGNFFPANVINSENLRNLIGIPVEALRMACSGVIAYFILKILQTIDAEVLRRLEQAEINQAVFAERERISRDIHDGVLQSIFSVGLSLGKLRLTLRSHMNEEDLKDVEFAVSKLNDVMSDVRYFINHLRTPLSYNDIVSLLATVSEEAKMYGKYSFESSITGDPVQLDHDKMLNIYYFIKEGFSNIQKHSFASNVNFRVRFSGDKINICIKDDGVGIAETVCIDNKRQGMGINNMYERAKKLNGRLEFKTESGLGTEVCLEIPV